MAQALSWMSRSRMLVTLGVVIAAMVVNPIVFKDGGSAVAVHTLGDVQTCLIHGWVSDSLTLEGIPGAAVQVATLVSDGLHDYLISNITSTNETGYYEVSHLAGLTMSAFIATGYYPLQYPTFDTTGLTEYRLDALLDSEPTTPTLSATFNPENNISCSHPLEVHVVSEDFNIMHVLALVGQIHERTEDWVNFTFLDFGTAMPGFNSSFAFEYTYEECVFDGTHMWSPCEVEAGYLINDTVSEFVVPRFYSNFNGDISYGVAGRYWNDTLNDESGYAIFDNSTGEYLGFIIEETMDFPYLPDALSDDPNGMFAPVKDVLSYGPGFSVIGFSTIEVVGERRAVAGLEFEYTNVAPSGEYAALVLVIDEAYNFNATVSVLTVDTSPPVADAGEDREVLTGVEVILSGADSHDDVGIDEYMWIFDDGEHAPLYGEEVACVFSEPGDYTVTLTVCDGGDNEGSDSVTITAIDDVEPPVANAGQDLEIHEGETAQFDADGSTDNLGISEFQWTFEYDGQPVMLTGETQSYKFDIVGVYVVTLTVRDQAGNSDTDTMTVTVLEIVVNDPPTADAGENATIVAGTELEFDGSGSSVDVVNYTWTFEYDGAPVLLYGESPSFTFEIEGTYPVNLTVTDEQGLKGYDEVVVTVTEENTASSLWIYAGVAVVAALAVALVVWFALRKKT